MSSGVWGNPHKVFQALNLRIVDIKPASLVLNIPCDMAMHPHFGVFL
jgi:hypothetical protein